MGAVFLAEQFAVGNRPVALKVLSRKLLDDPNFILRFQNEAASTGRIHHPNVVTIYAGGAYIDLHVCAPRTRATSLSPRPIRGLSWLLNGGTHVLFNDVAIGKVFPYPEGDECERRESMAIQLTPEQERRVHDVINRGAYESVEEVVDAALAAVEQRTAPGFAGTQEELDALLAEGLASKELGEDEFWGSVNAQTNALLAEHKQGPRS